MPKTEEQQTMEGIDTELSQTCDKLLRAIDELDEAKENVDALRAEVVTQLNRLNQTSVKHGGKTFEVAHKDAKDSLRIKSAG